MIDIIFILEMFCLLFYFFPQSYGVLCIIQEQESSTRRFLLRISIIFYNYILFWVRKVMMGISIGVNVYYAKKSVSFICLTPSLRRRVEGGTAQYQILLWVFSHRDFKTHKETPLRSMDSQTKLQLWRKIEQRVSEDFLNIEKV